jgi:hypothetical protein
LGFRSVASVARGDLTSIVTVPRLDDADERWRVVLAELVKRARTDPEFRARVEASGAVIDNFEAVLDRRRSDRSAPSGTVQCHCYWWGFQLEIPHATLEAWTADAIESAHVAASIGSDIGPATAFLRRAAGWIANHLHELDELDRGAGVYVSMTWMAPNIFVPIAVRSP